MYFYKAGKLYKNILNHFMIHFNVTITDNYQNTFYTKSFTIMKKTYTK
ncbi:hypothetical protein NEM27_13050 [Mammaliicoccus sciuri]|nr:hypothetical protein [Mammaliicoccus sciuri]MEB7067577.1 hypothetical protein [Mammaliicoccus sciuri]